MKKILYDFKVIIEPDESGGFCNKLPIDSRLLFTR